MRDHLLLLAIALVATTVGVYIYALIARKAGIVAVPNERTLHTKVTVRGGGVVVALVFLVGVLVLFLTGDLPQRWFLALFVGGLAISAVGFVDDIVHLSTGVRLLIHFALAVFAVACVDDPMGLGWAGYALEVLGMAWIINAYNFMDGIDGMAASGAVYFCAAAAVILEVQGSSTLAVPLALLGASTLGFLAFNWPPAKLFMGDSGSGFYGYTFGVFVLLSRGTGVLSVWTWLIILAYFIADPTTTLFLRMAKVPRWWGTHRSHAYQNLARVWDNHRRMTLLVIGINLVWTLPLAIASVEWPRAQLPLALLCVAPLVVLALKYGPRYEK